MVRPLRATGRTTNPTPAIPPFRSSHPKESPEPLPQAASCEQYVILHSYDFRCAHDEPNTLAPSHFIDTPSLLPTNL